VARFHIDQNAPGPAPAALLLNAGHDAETGNSRGMFQAADAEQLLHAARERRIVLTRDQDYRELHIGWHLWAGEWNVRPQPEPAGILILDPHWNADTTAHEVHSCLRRYASLVNSLYEYDRRVGWLRPQHSPYSRGQAARWPAQGPPGAIPTVRSGQPVVAAHYHRPVRAAPGP
jgi:uncharacterized protein DUF5615